MAETRRLLRDHLHRWGVPALTDTAELLTTELVTNALQHTQGGAVMTATLTPDPGNRLRIEVSDSAARRPPPVARQAHPRPQPEPQPAPQPERQPHPDQSRPSGSPSPDAVAEHGTSGRGLLLVAAMSDAWGIRPRGTGKVVWFELDANAA